MKLGRATLGHIRAPRTTGSQRTTTVTAGASSAQLTGHTPPPAADGCNPPRISDTEASWELRLGITVETTENREGGS
jgi:hypothetical protein